MIAVQLTERSCKPPFALYEQLQFANCGLLPITRYSEGRLSSPHRVMNSRRVSIHSNFLLGKAIKQLSNRVNHDVSNAHIPIVAFQQVRTAIHAVHPVDCKKRDM